MVGLHRLQQARANADRRAQAAEREWWSRPAIHSVSHWAPVLVELKRWHRVTDILENLQASTGSAAN